MANNNIVEQAKVAVILDGRDAETVLKELTGNVDKFTNALIKAYQAGDKKAMKEAISDLKNAETQLNTFKKQTFEVSKVLDNLSGSSIKDLRKALTQLQTDFKNALPGETRDQIKANIAAIKNEIKTIEGASKESGLSFKKMWEFAGGMGIAELAKKGFELLKKGFMSIIESSETLTNRLKIFTAGGTAAFRALGNSIAEVAIKMTAGADDINSKSKIWGNTFTVLTKSSLISVDVMTMGLLHLIPGWNNLYKGIKKTADAMNDAATAAKIYTAGMLEIYKEETKMIALRAKAIADISKARENSQDETKTIDERIKFLRDANDQEKKLSDETIKIQIDKTNKLEALKKSIAKDQWSPEMERNLQNELAKTSQLETESISNRRRAESALHSLIQEKINLEKSYQELMKKTSTAEEAARIDYNEELIKLKEFHDKGIISIDQYLKSQEALKIKYAANLATIANKKRADELAANKSNYDDLFQWMQESDNAVLAARQVIYEKDLAAAGDNALKKKAIERRYKLDVINIMLGQENEKLALAKSFGQDTVEIEKKIQQLKQGVIDDANKLDIDKQREHDQLLDKLNADNLIYQEQKEIEAADKRHEAGISSEEEYQAELEDIREKYLEKWIEVAKQQTENLSKAIIGIKDIETNEVDFRNKQQLKNLEDQQKQELRDLEANYAKGKISKERYEKQKALIQTKYDNATTDANEKSEKQKSEINKKYARIEFGLKVATIIADTAVAIMKDYAQLGPIGGTIAAVFTAATSAVQIATAKQQETIALAGFSKGGRTGDHISVNKPTGIVHGGEYVIPAWQRRTPMVMAVEPILESQRVRGYASGGSVTQSSQPTPNSSPFGGGQVGASDPELKNLMAINAMLMQKLIEGGINMNIGDQHIEAITKRQDNISGIKSKATRF